VFVVGLPWCVTKLPSSYIDRSLHGPRVEDIKTLLRGFVEHSIRYVRRTGNGVAHCLEKHSCKNKVCKVWFSDLTEFVVDLLASEYASVKYKGITNSQLAENH
jgi:hypothetical protein